MRRAAEGGRGLDHLSAALEEGDLVLYQVGSWTVDGVTVGDGDEPEKAADAARATLRYRAANSDLLRRAMEGGGSHEAALGALNKQALLSSPTLLGEPVHVVRAAASDVKKLMDDFTEEEVVEHLNLSKARAFLRCAAETRRRGETSSHDVRARRLDGAVGERFDRILERVGDDASTKG